MKMLFILSLVLAVIGWECEHSGGNEVVRTRNTGRELEERGTDKAPIRIHFEYIDFDLLSEDNNSYFKEVVMPSVGQYISSIVSTNPLQSPIVVPSGTCSGVTLPSSHQTTGVADADHILYISTRYERFSNSALKFDDCFYQGVLDYPVASYAQLNSVYASNYSFNTLFNLMAHALVHGLGFTNNGFLLFNKDSSGLKYTESEFVEQQSIRGVDKYLLKFPSLLQEARTVFDCPTLEGVELEDYGSSGSYGSHWDKRIVYTEFMIGQTTEEPVYSTLTFAVLKDSLWYDINFEYLQTPIFGRDKGCTFHTTQCIVDGQAQFREFCDTEGDACDYYHASKGECVINNYFGRLPEDFQYFDNPQEGGDAFADYCPIVTESQGGDCRLSSNTVDKKYGEITGNNSRCFMTTLLQNGYQYESTAPRSGCFEVVSCSADSATVRFGNLETGYKTEECPFNGRNVTWLDEYQGYIECPSYEILCSDIPCLNICYGFGKCSKGQCECNSGRFGNDCRYTACSDIPGCAGDCDEHGKCTTCQEGYYSESGECKACSAVDNCKVNCASDGGCQECNDGFFKENGSCTKCLDVSGCASTCSRDTGCTACIECYSNNDGICEQCDDCSLCCDSNQYLLDGVCNDCPSSCKTCDVNEVCTSCYNSGVVPNCCLQNQYFANGNCQDCPSDCATCNENEECLTCPHDGIAPICCRESEFYFEGFCFECYQNTDPPSSCFMPGHYFTSDELIQSIEFDKTFTKITVSFKTAPTPIDIQNPLDCTYYFLENTSSTLGSSPVCELLTSKNQLSVALGYNYTIRKGDIVYLNQLHLQKSSQKVDEAYHLLFSTIIGEEYPTPVVSLSAPKVFNKDCENSNLKLSASVSSGIANGDTSYLWTVDGGLSLSQQEATSPSLSIPSSNLGVNEYSFTLKLTNMFGKFSEDSVSVQVSEDDSILEVTIDIGNTVNIAFYHETFTVTCLARFCGELGQFEYLWEKIQDENVVFSSDNTLAIEQGSLNPESVHTFRCSATTEGKQGTADLTVNVEYSELVAKINHPEKSSISTGLDLSLDGRESYDPHGKEISFLWTCRDQTDSECTDNDGNRLISTANSATDAFSIGKERLKVGDVLDIYLLVSGDQERSSTAVSELTVVDGGVIEINVQEFPDEVRADRSFTVKLDIEGGSNVNWSQLDGDSLSPSSPSNLPWIFFEESTMLEGREYSYIATVESPTGSSMQIVVSWRTVQKPRCDSNFELFEESNGYYTVGINNCFSNEGNGDLYYIYGLKSATNSIPLYRSFSNTKELWLSSGLNTLVVFVCDEQSACIEDTLEITVGRRLEENSSEDVSTIRGEFEELKTEEGLIPYLILQFLSSYSITKSDWDYLYSELDQYTQEIVDASTALGEYEVSSFLGTILELTKQAFETDQIRKALEYALSVIEDAELKLRPTDRDILAEIFNLALNDDDISSRTVSKVIDLQKSMNRNLMQDRSPGVDDIKIETDNYASLTNRFLAPDIKDTLELDLNGKVNLSAVDLPFNNDEIIDIELISIKDSTVHVFFYLSGFYDSNSASSQLYEDSTELDTRDYEMKIKMEFDYISDETYKVFVLEDGEWVKDSSVKLILLDDQLEIEVDSLSTFSVQIYDEESKRRPWIPVAYILLLSVVSIVLLIFGIYDFVKTSKITKTSVISANVEPFWVRDEKAVVPEKALDKDYVDQEKAAVPEKALDKEHVDQEKAVEKGKVNQESEVHHVNLEFEQIQELQKNQQNLKDTRDAGRVQTNSTAYHGDALRSLVRYHLVFGIFKDRNISTVLKTLLLWMLLAIHLASTLVILDTAMEGDKHIGYCILVIIVSGVVCGATAAGFEFVLEKMVFSSNTAVKIIVDAILVILIIASYALLIRFRSGLDGVWVIVSMLSILFDIFILQTCLSAWKSIIKRKDPTVV